MIIGDPVPFREALDMNAVKSVLLTTGKTADLQRLEPAIKRRAMMSATVSVAKPLVKIHQGVQAILAGTADQATVRLGIKQLWEDLGYKPDPEKIGGLQDLGSTKRIDLQIETNVAIARGAGWHDQGMKPEVLEEFPAQELFDTAPGGASSKRRNWAERWERAGGTFYGSRMIALKTDPIWRNLGSPDLFPDGLGNEWPPYAFNSAWRVRDIDRAEAIELGVMSENTEQIPQRLDLDQDLAATPELREQWLRDAISDSGVGRFENGVLVFDQEGGA